MTPKMPATAKICGLSSPATLDAAVAGGASHAGFVFFPASPRHVDPDYAAGLASRLPQRVQRVGVFVDPDDDTVDEAVAAARLDVIQLHRCPPDRVHALRARTACETWAAVAVRTRADLDSASRYRGAADRLVYDARTPDGSALPGGMGVRFDWRLLDGFAHPLPWILSGGLDADNVGSAIRQTGARLVDVSSGVERAPGEKCETRIAGFLAAVAAA